MTESAQTAPSRVWWVNQVQTYQASRAGGFLWAPIWNKRGVERWSKMTEVQEGDITVHYSRGKIVALGQATSAAYQASCPPELQLQEMDTSVGRRVDVEYVELQPPLPLTDVAAQLLTLSTPKGPLNKHGHPKQLYLQSFSVEGLRVLRAASSSEWPMWAEARLQEVG